MQQVKIKQSSLDLGHILPTRVIQIHLKIQFTRMYIMQGSSALDKFDLRKSHKALKMLLIDRSNEFRIFAQGIGYPVNTENWELIVLNFCLDFVDCFNAMSGEDTIDHNQIHKCMTLMRQIARGKSNMTEMTHIENTAYLIAEDFKSIYKRME
ncbi:conserved protein of unknown function [Nitrosotalea devaniterrae]|uniref:Uncharacterized protein n=1 Tax=Nitrosotalea devaniterrae TaxID=1078905 RepID=A0A128A4M7_9ARCH|nr:conserved protein of unknown function [Candidatus Nitrosotalea devanaterra]